MAQQGGRPDAPADPDRAGLDDAEAELDRSRAVLAAGHAADARDSLLAVLERTTGRGPAAARSRARALRLLAIAEFETHGTVEALARLDESAAVAAAVGDEGLVALTWSERASVLDRSGRAPEARAALDRAVDMLDALDPRDRVIVLMRRGLSGAADAELRAGVEDLERAAELAAAHDLAQLQFMTLHNLGWLRHLLGDAPAALRAMGEADALDVDVSRGISLLDRGRVLLEAGLVDEARAVLADAIEVCESDGQAQAMAEARYELGRVAVLQGQNDEALEEVTRAAASFDARTAAGWVLRCRLAELRLRLVELHASGGPTRRAQADVARAAALAADARALVDEADIGGSLVARAARVLAGEARALAGDVAAAAAVLPADDDPSPLLSVRLDEHRARTAHALADGSPERARAQLRDAAHDLAVASLSATTLDLRTARLAHATVLARLDLALALDDGPLATLAAVDRWRASSSRLPPVRPAAGDETAALLTERRRLREELRDAPTDASDRWDELARVERRIAERRRAAGGAAGDADAELATVEVDDLLAALDDEDRDVVVTAVHDGEVVALRVVGGTPTIDRVGRAGEVASLARQVRADLRMLASRRLGPLESAVLSSLTAGAATLADAVLGDALRRRDGRLLVLPHGDLVGLPWGLLAPGRPVVTSASPSAWYRARRDAGDATTARDGVRIVRGPRLVAADEEAAAVAAAWDVAAPTDDATAGTLVDAMASGDVVHVVAHGQHHRQQPLFSSLSLGDGPCSLYDLETAGIAARQVVLAACDAGSATVRPGDEPLGLAAGMLALGARSVVAPVVPVADELLPPVMGRLHAALAQGLPTDEALVAATAGAPPVVGGFVVTGAAVAAAPSPAGRPAAGATGPRGT